MGRSLIAWIALLVLLIARLQKNAVLCNLTNEFLMRMHNATMRSVHVNRFPEQTRGLETA